MMKQSRLVKIATMVALIALLSLGCSMETEPEKKGHEHPEKGLRDGPLAEWGEHEYHVEWTQDPDKEQATVYILDGEVEKDAPIDATTVVTLTLKTEEPPIQIELEAKPQAKDPAGKSSRFIGTHEKLGTKLDPEKVVASAKIGETSYQGAFHVAD